MLLFCCLSLCKRSTLALPHIHYAFSALLLYWRKHDQEDKASLSSQGFTLPAQALSPCASSSSVTRHCRLRASNLNRRCYQAVDNCKSLADLVQSVLDGLSSHVNVNEHDLLQRDIADSAACWDILVEAAAVSRQAGDGISSAAVLSLCEGKGQPGSGTVLHGFGLWAATVMAKARPGWGEAPHGNSPAALGHP